MSDVVWLCSKVVRTQYAPVAPWQREQFIRPSVLPHLEQRSRGMVVERERVVACWEG